MQITDREFLLRVAYLEVYNEVARFSLLLFQSILGISSHENNGSDSHVSQTPQQIHTEQVRDLLADNSEDLAIHECKQRGFFVQNMREVIVTSVEQVLELFAEGESRRHFGRTNANEMSSRSHVIFRVVRLLPFLILCPRVVYRVIASNLHS
jgi:hypothetical protein